MWTFLAAEEPASLIVPDSVQKANLAEAVNKIVNMDFSTLFGSLIRESLWILVKVLIALAIYFIGRWLVRRFLRLIDVAMQHRNVDISLRSFTRNGHFLSVPAVSNLLWKFFQKKSKKEAFSGQQRVSQD